VSTQEKFYSDQPARTGPAKVLLKVCLYGTLAVTVVIAAARWMKSNSTPCLAACVNGLRQIDGAKEQYALEHRLIVGTPISADQIKEYFRGGTIPTCPDDGVIRLGALGELPTCSFSRKSERHTLVN
jgi:hypothetical protein